MRIPKKIGLVVAITLTLVLQTLLVITPAVHASTIKYPIADAWVGTQYPTVNHGHNQTLHCRCDTSLLSGNVTKRTYLKFDVSGIDPSTILGATLYLYCTADGNGTIDVDAHKTGDSWIEGPAIGDIDWTNAPAVGAYVTTTAVNGIDQWYGWGGNAMKDYVKAEAAGDGIVSFVVKLPNDMVYTHPVMWHRDFSSREGAHSPYLEITEGQPPAGGHMVPITMAEESSLPATPIYFVSVLLVAMAVTIILIRYERKRAAKTPKGC